MITLRNFPVLPLFVALLLLFGAGSTTAHALDVPPLSGRVNDTAHILRSSSVRGLEQTLKNLEQTDSTQIVVLTIPSLEGESLEPYALKVAETWKLGQKGFDNGALLLIAINDRKIRIETGYGLEGRLTDLVAGRIIRERIAPAFKRGEYDQGVINGVEAMAAAVKGEYTGKSREGNQGRQKNSGTFLMFLFFGLMVIGNIFSWKKSLAAGLGAVFAPLLAAVIFQGLFSWLIILLLIPVGIVGALFASVLAGTRSRHYGAGGIFPGGGFGGGSLGGGGFSGGGGGFGGGGASGGW
ncbi:MAG: TPM domain-containing protein [Desulfobulbaceae bacterium]|nr:TPM domain-containing protein [Desulfobulbaceae bacterium]